MSEREVQTLPSVEHDRVLAILEEDFRQFYQMADQEIEFDRDTSFLAMGADSLTLLQISQALQERFAIKIPFRLLMEEINTLGALAAYIAERLPAGFESTQDEAETVAVSEESIAAPQPSVILPDAVPSPQTVWQAAQPSYAPPQPVQTIPPVQSVPLAAPSSGASASGTLERIVASQLNLMAAQLAELRNLRQSRAGFPRAQAPAQTQTQPTIQAPAQAPVAMPASQPVSAPAPAPVATPAPVAKAPANPKIAPPNHTAGTKKGEGSSLGARVANGGGVARRKLDHGLTDRQQRYLSRLIDRLSRLTKGSKQQTQEERRRLADSRVPSGFRRLWKEICYQIVIARGQGARITDIDGNEFVDISMGFGSLMFGHSPDFILKAVGEQLQYGMQLGPQSAIAGEVAALIRDMAGVERSGFCNSGTEAVMTAVRIARTVTGRDKIVAFNGSYHGSFDGVMTRMPRQGVGSLPMAPGTTPAMVSDVLTLPYGDPNSLDILRQHADQLAGVLLEPVASRKPQVESAEFLRGLREITAEHGSALIFDEVITGFRTHPGGAQALFGVEADLVTYGKAIGGGMPIGVVAGKAEFMDAVDGGHWQYGDNSYPEAQTTLFRGTFFKHPLVMASSRAVLSHLKAAGPSLQENLTRRTRALCDRLNQFYDQHGFPIRMFNFASLFLFTFEQAPPLVPDLFFYQLLEKGVYVWEGRTCYLSTAHTEADIEQLVEAVEQTAFALRRGGFMPAPDDGGPKSGTSTGKVEETRIPMNETQRDLWATANFQDAASRSYNESLALRFESGAGEKAFDRKAMERAIWKVVDRHEALRCRVEPEGEALRISPRRDPEIPFTDLSQLSGDEQAARFEQWIDEQASTAFDLVRGPLSRFAIARLTPERHVLAITIHHLVTDGWSNGVLLQDLRVAYARERGGRHQSVEGLDWPEAISMATGLDRLREVSDTQAAEAFWLAELADAEPLIELPSDHPLPVPRDFRGEELVQSLEPDVLSALKRLSQEYGTSLFVVLQAAMSAFLHRLSGQTDLVVTTASAGQPTLGLNHMMGYFLELLPLRSRFEPEQSFAEYLVATRKRVLDAFQHRHFPMSRMVKRLGLKRDFDHPPFLSVTLNLDQTLPPMDFGVEKVEMMSLPNGFAKFEISVNAMEEDGALNLEWIWRSDRFEARTMESFVDAFEALLRGASQRPETALARLPLLDERAAQQILTEFRGQPTPYPRDLPLATLFEKQVEARGRSLAISDDDEDLTYGALNARANQLARHLRHAGCVHESPIGIFLERSNAAIMTLLAEIKAVGAYVPLAVDLPDERLALLLDDAGIEIVVTNNALKKRLSAVSDKVKVLSLDGEKRALSRRGKSNLKLDIDPRQAACLIYTSGSTGQPKGVVITQRGVARLTLDTNFITLQAGERVSQTSTLSFDAAIYEVWGALLNGCELAPFHRDVLLAPTEFEAQMEAEPLQVMFLSTALFEQLVREVPGAFRELRALMVGGQKLERSAAANLFADETSFAGRLINCYGPTECTTYATWHSLERGGELAERIPVGRPVSNTETYLLDTRLEPVPVGAVGEIYLGGDGLARGYFGRPARTARSFIPHPFVENGSRLYSTGDLGRYLPDGSIDFLGRRDHQVKIRGFRVEPGEIEATLLKHPQVDAAVVVTHQQDDQPARLIAYVVPTNLNEQDLRLFLESKLPAYMMPSVFITLGAMPLNRNGKVDRQALPTPDGAGLNFDAYLAPSTATEEALASIWADVLGVDRVGIQDNFFELGGDSILAIQIIAQAEEQGLKLRPRQLFQFPTVGELAALAESAHEEGTALERGVGDFSLTPIQRWFFEDEPQDPDHFNMQLMVELHEPLDLDLLLAATREVVAHHDALCLRLENGSSGWQARVENTPGEVDLKRYDLSDQPEEKQLAEIERLATRRQQELDLATGRLLNLTLFHRGKDSRGENRRDQLLFIAHHVAVDFVSWRLILEEIQIAYRQLREARPVSLPAATTPFKTWSERLVELSRDPAWRAEKEHWSAVTRQPLASLPVDRTVPEGYVDREGETDTVVLSLESDTTATCLSELPKTFDAQLNDVLLALLGATLTEWAEGAILVDLEGHGREDLFDDVNLSRTVGWFTAIYPVRLEPSTDLVGACAALRDELRANPNGGLGHGLLRYLCEDPEVAGPLREAARAQVSFNYLGRLRNTAGGPYFSEPIYAETGPTRAPSTRRHHLFEVTVLVADDRLHLYWTYGQKRHERRTVEALAQAYLNHLRRLVGAPLVGASHIEAIPNEPSSIAASTTDAEPDLSLVDLDADTLNDLLREVEGEDD